jgi:hypothetical protein
MGGRSEAAVAWRRKALKRFQNDVHARNDPAHDLAWQAALRAAVRAELPNIEKYRSLALLRAALGWRIGAPAPRAYDPVTKMSYAVANLPDTKGTKAAKPRKTETVAPLTKQQQEFALTPGLQDLAEQFAEQASCIKGLRSLTVVLYKGKKFKFRYKVRQAPLVFEFDQTLA